MNIQNLAVKKRVNRHNNVRVCAADLPSLWTEEATSDESADICLFIYY